MQAMPIRVAVVLVAFAIIAPTCGSMLAAACASGCCCDEMAGGQMECTDCLAENPAVPASTSAAAVNLDHAPAMDIATVLHIAVQATPESLAFETPLASARVNSPPELYLLHSILLI